jgi:gamma-glutamylcyclotransferase (GGCT)/AIG2-like uncharacterized protein YtfP
MKIAELLTEAGEQPIYYFAYGMLTDPDHMQGVELVGKAELKNFTFQMYCYANVFPQAGSKVFGSLWVINREILHKLDMIEGYPSLYDRKMVPVTCNGERYEAFVYVMTPQTIEDVQGSEPSKGYINRIIRGYKNAGIPLQQLENSLK